MLLRVDAVNMQQLNQTISPLRLDASHFLCLRENYSSCPPRQYITPMLFHALAEIQHKVVPETDLPEDAGAKALRRAETWSRMRNGGFQTQNARAYQDA